MPLLLERALRILPRVTAYNPNHDEQGRFAESGESQGQHHAKFQSAREAYRQARSEAFNSAKSDAIAAVQKADMRAASIIKTAGDDIYAPESPDKATDRFTKAYYAMDQRLTEYDESLTLNEKASWARDVGRLAKVATDRLGKVKPNEENENRISSQFMAENVLALGNIASHSREMLGHLRTASNFVREARAIKTGQTDINATADGIDGSADDEDITIVPARVTAYNPNHDEQGRFAEGDGSAGGLEEKTDGLDRALTREFDVGGQKFLFEASTSVFHGETWEINFGKAKDNDFTVKQDSDKTVPAREVLREVGRAVDQFIRREAPKEIEFTSNNKEGGRTRLYQRLARMIAEKHGYSLATDQSKLDDRTVFTLTRNVSARALPRVTAYNPNHDEQGRFAESAGEGGGGGGGKRFLDRIKERLGMAPKPSLPTDSTFNGKLQHALSTQPNRVGPRGMPITKVDGKEYLIKRGALKEEEALASQLGRENGIDVAKVEAAQINGRPVAAVEWIEGARSISEMRPAEARAALSAVPREVVERQALFDYAIGNSDANQGNTIFKDGRMIAIDKEFSLSSERGAAATSRLMPEHLRHIAPGNATGNFSFTRGNVDHMIQVGGRIANRLDGMGRTSQAGGVRDRIDVMRQFSEQPDQNLTVQTLEMLGAMGPRR